MIVSNKLHRRIIAFLVKLITREGEQMEITIKKPLTAAQFKHRLSNFFLLIGLLDILIAVLMVVSSYDSLWSVPVLGAGCIIFSILYRKIHSDKVYLVWLGVLILTLVTNLWHYAYLLNIFSGILLPLWWLVFLSRKELRVKASDKVISAVLAAMCSIGAPLSRFLLGERVVWGDISYTSYNYFTLSGTISFVSCTAFAIFLATINGEWSLAIKSNGEGLRYVSIAKHIILFIITFGIWYYIWLYRTARALPENQSDFSRKPSKDLLLSLFVPFYHIYWCYKTAQAVDKRAKQCGIESDTSVLCLITSIFVPFLPSIIIQDKINSVLYEENKEEIEQKIFEFNEVSRCNDERIGDIYDTVNNAADKDSEEKSPFFKVIWDDIKEVVQSIFNKEKKNCVKADNDKSIE